MKLVSRPSPNYRPRTPGVRVDTVLLHHTGDRSGASSLAWLTNPSSGVSAHYLVDRDGTVYSLVPEERAAWHAGMGRLPWETCPAYDFNHRSVGVEIANAGDGKEPFTEAQYVALGELVPDVLKRMGRTGFIVRRGDDGQWMYQAPWYYGGFFVPTTHAVVTGHRDIAMPRGRKTDPADNFDWKRVRDALAGGTT